MSAELLTATDAAHRLGLSRATLYGWLGLSDRGLLVIRGQAVTIQYYQAGHRGQGKILIEPSEIERLKELMRVQPRPLFLRHPPTTKRGFPGIVVPLGRPDPR